jgi:ABC-type transporter Mla MlaB component
MLKITVGGTENTLRLKLEGNLAGPWVGLLEEVWEKEASAAPQHTVVDVSGVMFVDHEGRRVLVEMCRQGICFQATGCLLPLLLEEIRRECQSAVEKS